MKIQHEKKLEFDSGGIFETNITAFKAYMPSIYEFIKKYTPSVYFIENDTQGFANILNKKNNQFVYLEDPYQYSNLQTEIYFKSPKRLIYNPQKEKENNFIFLHQLYLGECNEFLNLKKVECKKPEHLHFYIPTLVMLGVGLGYQIAKILSEHHITNLYIFEPEPDIFYASLHTIDWGNILKKMRGSGKNITLQIGNNYIDLLNTIGRHHFLNGYYSISKIYLYQHTISKETNLAMSEIQKLAHRLFKGFGFYEDELLSLSHTLANVKEKSFFIKEKSNFKKNFIQYPPALIIANGPSLDKEIEFIKKNQGKFILFSCGSTLKTLYKNGITPDFHVEIERTKEVYDWLMNINDIEYFKKIDFLSLCYIYPKSAPLFKRFIWGLKPNDTGEKLLYKILRENRPAIIPHCNPTVSNGALSIATYLGFKEVYLFGMDMGFRQANYHHSLDSGYYESQSRFYQPEMTTDIKIPANFSGEIYSTQELDNSRLYLEFQLRSCPEVVCYNCSDGAKIELTIPKLSTEIQSYTEIDKINFIEELITATTESNQFIDQNKIIHQFYQSYITIENLIYLLKMAMTPPPKNREELDLVFHQQFSTLMQMNQKDPLASGLLMGTMNYLQCSIFCHLSEITDIDNFNELVQFSFKIIECYLNDMLELTQNHYQTIDKEINLNPFIQRALETLKMQG